MGLIMNDEDSIFDNIQSVDVEKGQNIIKYDNVRKNIEEQQLEDVNIIPYEGDEEEVCKPNCKLCNSDLRKSAEEKFAAQSNPNYLAIERFLKDNDEMISYAAVRNHLIYHFKHPQQQQTLIEYSDDLKRWLRIQPDKINNLRKTMIIIQRELTLLAAEADSLQGQERRKNAETVKKLADTLLTFEKEIEQMEKALEPVTVIINQLKIIITDEIEKTQSPETKGALINVVQKLNENIGDMEII